MGIEFQFWKIKRALEALGVIAQYLTMGRMVNFMLYMSTVYR